MSGIAGISAPRTSTTMSTARVTANQVPIGTRQHLSAEQLAHARAFLQQRGMPVDHLENVVFVKGMNGHGWIVDRARENGNPAITRGNIVYVREDFWVAATNPNRETFWSEIFHTSQYQQGNFESRYLSGVIGSLVIGGDGHEGNIMETVAHNRGAEMALSWTANHR
jgi:hypothetical protein